MKFMKKEEAVSPVIGVILMVAITVILAAVIGAFVFGLAGSVQKTKNVAITAAQKGTNQFLVTNHGGPDIGQVTNLSLNGTNSAGLPIAGTLDIAVGSTATVTCATSGQDHVIVVARFNDGTEQVVLDTYV
jgi:flagellin-like protein